MFKNINKKIQMFCLKNAERCISKYKETQKFKYLQRSLEWINYSIFFTTDHEELNYLKNGFEKIIKLTCK